MLALRTIGDGEELAETVARHVASNGSVLAVSVDEIRKRSGQRWALKADAVRSFAERHFRQIFSPADRFVRLDDAHFLILQSREPGPAAQGRAVNFLREVLEFFLGVSELSDVKVARVSSIGADRVELDFLAAEEIAAAAARAGDPAGGDDTDGATDPDVSAGWTRPPAFGADFPFHVHPVWTLSKAAILSHRLVPAGPPPPKSAAPRPPSPPTSSCWMRRSSCCAGPTGAASACRRRCSCGC